MDQSKGTVIRIREPGNLRRVPARVKERKDGFLEAAEGDWAGGDGGAS